MSNPAQQVDLVDAHGTLIGVASVAVEKDLWIGKIDLSDTPPNALALFREFDEMVNGQTFSLADELTARIAALGTCAILGQGNQRLRITDLQIYPTDKGISFRT